MVQTEMKTSFPPLAIICYRSPRPRIRTHSQVEKTRTLPLRKKGVKERKRRDEETNEHNKNGQLKKGDRTEARTKTEKENTRPLHFF